MDYKEVCKLATLADRYRSGDFLPFISSVGWRDWMENATEEEEGKTLRTIWDAVHPPGGKTAWVFSEYRDRAGTGSTVLFSDLKTAVAHAVAEWDRLSPADRKSYKCDTCGMFFVARLPMEWEPVGGEWVPVFDNYTPLWDALRDGIE